MTQYLLRNTITRTFGFKVCKEIHSVQDCYSMLAKTDRIVLFIRSKDTLENLEKSIRNLIKKKLPSHFEPFKIVPLNDEHLPMTSHGKC